MALASAGTVAMLGCGDPTVSIGSDTGPIAVEPSTVNVNAPPCPAGYEHATICCTGDNGQNAPACMRYIGTPFHPCATGWLTYPNENVCCSIDKPSDCIDAPARLPENAGAIIGATNDCGFPPKCPPGTSPDWACHGFGCWWYVPGSGGKPATRDGFCQETKYPPSSSLSTFPSPDCTYCPSNWLPWFEPGVCCRGDGRGSPEMCFATTRYVPLTKR
ncbi:hypothetical protein LZC95_53060 [Pendulispora brunnea]|uniref:Uncharacterized protein n=1 Tax=Pendulispora brunnea TaxID=2905690 RepID=A0ABZ2KC40_9BACT